MKPKLEPKIIQHQLFWHLPYTYSISSIMHILFWAVCISSYALNQYYTYATFTDILHCLVAMFLGYDSSYNKVISILNSL